MVLAFSFSDPQNPKSGGFRTNANGALTRATGTEELRQSLLMLFSTQPGERGLQPDYGCDLEPILFEPNDDSTAGLAMRIVALAVAAHEPRAEITQLDAGPDPAAPSHLQIRMEFKDRRDGKLANLTHTIALEDSR